METDLNKYIGKSFQSDSIMLYIYHIEKLREESGSHKYSIFYFKNGGYITAGYTSDTRLRKLKRKGVPDIREEAMTRIFDLAFGHEHTDRNRAISEKIHFHQLMAALHRKGGK
jgi:hypothetical protein